MIWYLLYPFRGTTEPPHLSPSHPLRATFAAYGTQAARHPILTLLVSVAAGILLIYPIPFLYTNQYRAGASNLPHHVWTAAQPCDGSATPDVVMRSVWIHGDFMKVLKADVLLRALEIQDELLGSTRNFHPSRGKAVDGNGTISEEDALSRFTLDRRDALHAINGYSKHSWFFHSPLQYWNCSAEVIEADPDFITTINEQAARSTSVNITLRHSMVFSGKRFEDHRLIAADALVITLVHMLDSDVGIQWVKKAEALAQQQDPRWNLYPSNGRATTSSLYEFRFQPLSFQDDILLGAAYGMTTFYFLLSLSKLRALKSRFGLIVAVVTQIGVSIMSSFTICAVFQIDLSKIPRETYPLVVLTIGLENMFRLINAVIVTPPGNPTASRVAEALGNTGHIALAGVAQNLCILWVLSKIVSDGVAAFCAFAAIALTVDYFYLITFFVSVLSVEIRRKTLSDFLNQRGPRQQSHTFEQGPLRKAWTDTIACSKVPVSTRIAGSVVMISFILGCQWHFFDNESPLRTASRALGFWKQNVNLGSEVSALVSAEVNMPRTPQQWLRMQDHETAREVINVIKPDAHSYIARVHDPLIFVLSGADRNASQAGIRRLLPVVYDFAKNQTIPFAVAVVVLVAGVSMLMNYLLWNEPPDLESENSSHDHPLLAVATLNKGHQLDVVMLVGSCQGLMVSVGLDRCIRVWDLKNNTSYTVPRNMGQHDTFPVAAIAIDHASMWLAIATSSGLIILWNILDRRWGLSVEVDYQGRPPLKLLFSHQRGDSISSVILVRPNGLMTDIDLDNGTIKELHICKSPLIWAVPVQEISNGIATVSRRGCVHIAQQKDNGWVSIAVDDPWIGISHDVKHILPVPGIDSFLACRTGAVDLIDLRTLSISHTFLVEDIKPQTLRCMYATRRTHSGALGLTSFSLVYTQLDKGACMVQSYRPDMSDNLICMRPIAATMGDRLCTWFDAKVTTMSEPEAGDWEVLDMGIVVGVRRRRSPSTSPPQITPGLRRRGNGAHSHPPQDMGSAWEAWLLSTKGDRAILPLDDPLGSDGTRHLFVDELGPIAKVGTQSIVVALGNVVKVITVGHERFEDTEGAKGLVVPGSNRRKRGGGCGARKTC